MIKVSNLAFVKTKIYHTFEALMPGNRQIHVTSNQSLISSL